MMTQKVFNPSAAGIEIRFVRAVGAVSVNGERDFRSVTFDREVIRSGHEIRTM